MKTNTLIMTAVLATSGITMGRADSPAEPAPSDMRAHNNAEVSRDNYASDDYEVFSAREFTLDVFGTGTVGQDIVRHPSNDRIRDDGRLGAGLGVNYFFTRHFGIGAQAYTENTDHFFVDSVSTDFIVRFPIDAIRLAPYVFGGAGHQFDPVERWYGEAGAGLEFRFAKHWGIFVDGRYEFINDASDVGLARAGFRFAF